MDRSAVEPQPSTDVIPLRLEQDEQISLLELLIVLVRRKRFIGACALALGLIAAVTTLVLPSRYTATTVILPPQSSSAGSALMSQLNNLGPMLSLAGGGLGIKNQNDMYIAMLKSQTVEDAMVHRFNLSSEYRTAKLSDARKALESHCDIESGTKDSLIRISVTDKDPKRAAELANGYVEEYQKFSETLAITEASQRRVFFQHELTKAKDDLANAEEALKQTQQNTGLIQPDSQARALIETAASLRAQIAAKEVQIRAMRSFASSENPDLEMAEEQLAGWQAQLSALGASKSGANDDLLVSKGRVPTAGLEYLRKYRDVKYYETIFELLARQFEVAKLDEAKQGSLIQVMDPALVPDRRSFPKRTLITLAAIAIGFLFGIFWVLASEAMRSVRRNPLERERLERLKALIFK